MLVYITVMVIRKIFADLAGTVCETELVCVSKVMHLCTEGSIVLLRVLISEMQPCFEQSDA